MKKMICKPATLDAVKEKKLSTSKSKAGGKKQKKTQPSEEFETSSGIGTLFALEPRIMFDGAALATGRKFFKTPPLKIKPSSPASMGRLATDSMPTILPTMMRSGLRVFPSSPV